MMRDRFEVKGILEAKVPSGFVGATPCSHVPLWVLDQAETLTVLRMFHLIASFPDEFRFGRPKIAKWLGCSQRTVTRTSRGLMEMGALALTSRYRGFRRQRSNIYTLYGYSPSQRASRPTQGERTVAHRHFPDFDSASLDPEEDLYVYDGPAPSALLPVWVLDRVQTLDALRVFHLIASEGGNIEWSRNKLANLLGCSVATLKRARRDLERIGALVITKHRDASTDWQSSRHYTLFWESPEKRAAKEAEEAEESSQ